MPEVIQRSDRQDDSLPPVKEALCRARAGGAEKVWELPTEDAIRLGSGCDKECRKTTTRPRTQLSLCAIWPSSASFPCCFWGGSLDTPCRSTDCASTRPSAASFQRLRAVACPGREDNTLRLRALTAPSAAFGRRALPRCVAADCSPFDERHTAPRTGGRGGRALCIRSAGAPRPRRDGVPVSPTAVGAHRGREPVARWGRFRAPCGPTRPGA